jgi:hypothetical protein
MLLQGAIIHPNAGSGDIGQRQMGGWHQAQLDKYAQLITNAPVLSQAVALGAEYVQSMGDLRSAGSSKPDSPAAVRAYAAAARLLYERGAPCLALCFRMGPAMPDCAASRPPLT